MPFFSTPVRQHRISFFVSPWSAWGFWSCLSDNPQEWWNVFSDNLSTQASCANHSACVHRTCLPGAPLEWSLTTWMLKKSRCLSGLNPSEAPFLLWSNKPLLKRLSGIYMALITQMIFYMLSVSSSRPFGIYGKSVLFFFLTFLCHEEFFFVMVKGLLCRGSLL